MPTPYRGSKACSICHKKKVKCDLAEGNRPCTNCRLGDYPCRPHQRKRKRYSTSPAPLRGIAEHEQAELGISAGTGLTIASECENPTLDASTGTTRLVGDAMSPRIQLPKPDAYETPSTERSYVGRSEYLGGQVPFTENTAVPPKNPSGEPELADLDVRSLRLRRAFDLPPRAIRESLIDAFMERCHPWMPILERRWLEESDQRRPSLLLLQSVFLAGSRVSSSPLVYASSADFFERAKALFFHSYEQNTLLAIVAVIIMQWWNPTGPEKISTSTSGFWVRIGVELAYQVGLHKEPEDGPFKNFRRRLWWTLVSRDSIISVGTGRPRTINLEDSNVKPPSIEDFAVPSLHASLFVAYISICRQMSDIAEAQRRRQLTSFRKQQFENALFRWLKELPSQLRLFQSDEARTLAPYNFEARQLAVPYFVSLIILHRSSGSQAPASTVSLMASSFVVTIIEEFLSRDQLRYLGPVFTFYALAAGLVQVTGFRYETLSEIAEHEFNVIRMALNELGHRWGSAHGALVVLTRAKDGVKQQPRLQDPPPALPADAAVLFDEFGPQLCRLWDSGLGRPGNRDTNTEVGARQAETWDYFRSGMRSRQSPRVATHPTQEPNNSTYSSLFEAETAMDIYGSGVEEMPLFDESLAPMEGFWLFED